MVDVVYGTKATTFSRKQRMLFNWWMPGSPVENADGIIADGSIRSGKTYPMAQSFIEWAMSNFVLQNFIMAGKTISSFKRNVITWLLPSLRANGYIVEELRKDNLFVVSGYGRSNTFYMFGGKDEQSQDLIQGVTAAGAYFDEVALMPESFVNQSTGRCSVEGAKFWFNCNPGAPTHWFKKDWIDRHKEKNLLHLHFMMPDNPSLSGQTIERYSKLYTGVFYQRFILGKWVTAEGAIFDMWTDDNVIDYEVPQYEIEKADRYIAVDYGTQNAMVFLDVLDLYDEIIVLREYYYSGRDRGVQKTDSQYGDDFDEFIKDCDIRQVVIDPSASSFIAELKNRGHRIKEADNEVVPGIRLLSTLIGNKILKVHRDCEKLIEEIQSYTWDTKSTDRGMEKPVKKDDHGPDALRYFAKTVVKRSRLLAISGLAA